MQLIHELFKCDIQVVVVTMLQASQQILIINWWFDEALSQAIHTKALFAGSKTGHCYFLQYMQLFQNQFKYDVYLVLFYHATPLADRFKL